MRTIEKILKYNFSEKQIEEMKKSGIINGCGGKGGVDFSEVIEIFFKKFEKFKNEKLEELWKDIEQLCYEHDYDYYIQKGFKKANFDFALGVFRLVKSWTSFSERFLIFMIIYFLLNKYGKKYYDENSEIKKFEKKIKIKSWLHVLQVLEPKNLAKIFIFINRKIMEKLYSGGYDLSTLNIDNLTLDMIPNYTQEMEKRRLELLKGRDGKNPPREESNEYGTLEFIRAADFYRDSILMDGKIDESEKPNVIRALQCLARINKIKAGIDNY